MGIVNGAPFDVPMGSRFERIVGYAPGTGVFLENAVFLNMLMQKPQIMPPGRRRLRIDPRNAPEVDQDRFLSGGRADGFAIPGHLGQLIFGLLDLFLALPD